MGCTEQIVTNSLVDSSEDFKPINSFKGIPYAVPPLGGLRFRKPEPITQSYKRLINATKYGKSCLQPPVIDVDENPINFIDSSENCLFLNIFSPTLNQSSLLPVLFYIHGGAYKTDSSRDYPGEQLALRDVVVVTINYRLGVFGFLCADTADAPGNMGLWDQALALQWVHKYIKHFGGNPKDITLFGQSFGSASVATHIVSNITQNYFRKAILMSGSNLILKQDVASCKKDAEQFANQMGCPGLDFNCLRNKTSYNILIGQAETDNFLNFKYALCIGEQFIPKNALELINKQNFNPNINILTGHTLHEGPRFFQYLDATQFTYGRYDPQVLNSIIDVRIARNDTRNLFFKAFPQNISRLIAKEYTKTFENSDFASNLTERNRLRNVIAHSIGDLGLVCATVLYSYNIVKQSIFTGSVYQYYLSYTNTKSLCYNSTWCNTTHWDDIPLVFGYPFSKPAYTSEDRRMSTVMMDIWTEFAKCGKVPDLNGSVWPTYTKNKNGEPIVNYMELDSNRFRVHRNKYKGNNGFKPNVIQNCINFWKPYY